MDSLAADIEQFNSRLLLLARDPVIGSEVLRLLLAEPSVITQITAASEGGIRTAMKCGVPLAAFTEEIDELIQGLPRERAPRGESTESTPVTLRLRDLTTLALQVAQRLALENDTMAVMHFGLRSSTAEALTRLGITQLESMTHQGHALLRLRKGDEPLVWDRLLIGNVSNKAWAFRVSHETALLMSGAD